MMQIGIDSFAAAFDDAGLAASPAVRLAQLLERIERADHVGLDVFGIGFLVSTTGQFSPIIIWLPSIIADDNKQFPLEEVRSRAIATECRCWGAHFVLF